MILTPDDVRKIDAPWSDAQLVLASFTPHDLIVPTTEPEIIRPGVIMNFGSLLARRDDVRHLKLLPVKTPELHASYHQHTIEELMAQVREKLGGHAMVLASNDHPYALPPDVGQHILWTDGQQSREAIALFAASCLKALELTPHEAIFFERSRAATTKYVRRSFPHVHHLHCWLPRR